MKNKIFQGADGMNFELQMTIVGINSITTPKESLKNEFGKEIVTISCYGSKLSVYINLPQAIRPDNVIPFQTSDCIELETVRSMIINFINLYLQKHLKEKYCYELLNNLTVTKMECNTTIQCDKKCRVKDVVKLFEKSFSDVHLYKEISEAKEKNYNKSEIGMIHRKSHEWVLKVYDKTFQQKKLGNTQVDENLIRVELIFLDRALNRMYSNNRTIKSILTKESLQTLIEQYHITLNDIYENNIKKTLNDCKTEIFKSLIAVETGNEINETLIKCKEYIVDVEVLRRALKKWYKVRDMADNSKQVIYHYKKEKNIEIPAGVLETIKSIH